MSLLSEFCSQSTYHLKKKITDCLFIVSPKTVFGCCAVMWTVFSNLCYFKINKYMNYISFSWQLYEWLFQWAILSLLPVIKLDLAESYKGLRHGRGSCLMFSGNCGLKQGLVTTFSTPTTESFYELFVKKIIIVGDSDLIIDSRLNSLDFPTHRMSH